MKKISYPKKQGLYDPQYEHGSCGVGFVANINGEKSHAIIEKGIEVLKRLLHRGATGGDVNTGDGAGILTQIPDRFAPDRAAWKEPRLFASSLLKIGAWDFGPLFEGDTRAGICSAFGRLGFS